MGFFDRLRGKGGPNEEAPKAEAPQEAEEKAVEGQEAAPANEAAEISSRDLGKQRVDQLRALADQKYKGFKASMGKLGGWLAGQLYKSVGYTEKEWDRTDFKKRGQQLKKGAKVAGMVAAAPVVLTAGAVVGAGKMAFEGGKAVYAKGAELKKKAEDWEDTKKAEWAAAYEKQKKEIIDKYKEIKKNGREARLAFRRRVSEAQDSFRNWRNEQVLKLLAGAEIQGAAKEAVQKTISRQERLKQVVVDLSSIEPVDTGIEIEGEPDENEEDPLDAFMAGRATMGEAMAQVEAAVERGESGTTFEDEKTRADETEEQTVRIRAS